MKLNGKRVAAAASAILLAMGAVPTWSAAAVYKDSSEIAFSLRAVETENCGYIADGNTVYVSPSAAKAGTSVRIGMYIEAEYADLAFIYAKLQSDSDNITFNKEKCHNPTVPYSAEAITYTMSDGTQFSTTLKPYCLGFINSAGYYRANSFGLTTKFTPEENSMNLTWMYGYEVKNSTSATFFGSRSDEYSFIEMELDIAADTQPGEYRISFVTGGDGVEDLGATRLTSDDTVNSEEGSIYHDMVPTLKNLDIIIPSGEYFTMENPVAFRWLDDTTPLDAADFYPEGTTVYRDTDKGYAAEAMDFEKLSAGVHGKTIQYLTDPDVLLGGGIYTTEYDGMTLNTPDCFGDKAISCRVKSGLRGDANMDKKVNAVDAAAILVYAAKRGAGENPTLYSADNADSEQLAYFLADVNEGSASCGIGDDTSLDAIDASSILTYAAAAGSGETPDWNAILK